MVVIKRRKDGQKPAPPKIVNLTGPNPARHECEAESAKPDKYWPLKYVILLLFVPAFLNHAALYREVKGLQPQGELYDVGWGQKLFMGCFGKGAPTVILDAPTGLSSDAWTLVVPRLAKVTKVCVYDRAGLGFSDRPYVNRSQTEGETDSKIRGSPSTTERMVEDFHRLFTSASDQPKPFILVGAELGAVNMRFYAQMFEHQISGLVLVNPLVEGLFNLPDQTWTKHWQSKQISVFQTLQFSAAVGASRIALILGLMKTQMNSTLIPAVVVARQKYLMCKPAHLSSAVDEYFFANESLSQMRTLCRIKPFPSTVGVSVVSSFLYSKKPADELNKVWLSSQDHICKVLHPGCERIQLTGSAESVLLDHSKTIAKVIERHVVKWRKENEHRATVDVPTKQ